VESTKEHKTVWMVSGNKGGVGKSLFCLALASALELDGQSFSILDGDGRTGDVFNAFLRKSPACHADFRELRPESHYCPQDENYELMIHQLLKTSSHLIINTPDGADSILMRWFDMTLKHTEESDYQFKLMYLMSDRPDGLDMLPELAKRFSYFFPIRNLYFGRPEIFEAFNRLYKHQFHNVLDFPTLRAEEVRMLFDLKTYPTEVMTLKRSIHGSSQEIYASPALTRARLHRWQFTVCDLLGQIIDGEEISNVKVTN
jgi:hypothetical protein